MPIDYSKYPPNWLSEIRPRILGRAKNRCEKCGVKNKQFLYAFKMWIRDSETGRYKYKAVWVHRKSDAVRFLGGDSPLIYTVTVVLTIAHLDHDETNMDIQDDRLMAMCQYCHLNYDAKEKYKRMLNKSNGNS